MLVVTAGVTVTVRIVLPVTWLLAAAVATTVTGYAPTATEAPTVAETLLDTIAAPTVAGEKAIVMPAGAPRDVSTTSPENPLPREIVSPALEVDPTAAENDCGVAVTDTVPGAGGGVIGGSPPPHPLARSSEVSANAARTEPHNRRHTDIRTASIRNG